MYALVNYSILRELGYFFYCRCVPAQIFWGDSRTSDLKSIPPLLCPFRSAQGCDEDQPGPGAEPVAVPPLDPLQVPAAHPLHRHEVPHLLPQGRGQAPRVPRRPGHPAESGRFRANYADTFSLKGKDKLHEFLVNLGIPLNQV